METAMDWKGLRVTVKLTVQNRQAVKNTKHNGNISLDDVIDNL
jgi:hypothetical protein